MKCLIAFVLLAQVHVLFGQTCPASKNDVIFDYVNNGHSQAYDEMYREVSIFYAQKGQNLHRLTRFGGIESFSGIDQILKGIASREYSWERGFNRLQVFNDFKNFLDKSSDNGKCFRIVLEDMFISEIDARIGTELKQDGAYRCHCFDTITTSSSDNVTVQGKFGGKVCSYLHGKKSFIDCLEASWDRGPKEPEQPTSPFDEKSNSCKNGLTAFRDRTKGNFDGNYDCIDFSGVDLQDSRGDEGRVLYYLKNSNGSFKGARFFRNNISQSIWANVSRATFEEVYFQNTTFSNAEINMLTIKKSIFSPKITFLSLENSKSPQVNLKENTGLFELVGTSISKDNLVTLDVDKVNADSRLEIKNVKMHFVLQSNYELSYLKCENSLFNFKASGMNLIYIEKSSFRDCSISSSSELGSIEFAETDFWNAFIKNIDATRGEFLIRNNLNPANKLTLSNVDVRTMNLKYLASFELNISESNVSSLVGESLNSAALSVENSSLIEKISFVNSSNLDFQVRQSEIGGLSSVGAFVKLNMKSYNSQLSNLKLDGHLELDFYSSNSSIVNMQVSSDFKSRFLAEGGSFKGLNLKHIEGGSLKDVTISSLNISNSDFKLLGNVKLDNINLVNTKLKSELSSVNLKSATWDSLSEIRFSNLRSAKIEYVKNENEIKISNSTNVLIDSSELRLILDGEKNENITIRNSLLKNSFFSGVLNKFNASRSKFVGLTTNLLSESTLWQGVRFQDVEIENSKVGNLLLKDSGDIHALFKGTFIGNVEISGGGVFNLEFEQSKVVNVNINSVNDLILKTTNSSLSLKASANNADLTLGENTRVNSLSLTNTYLRNISLRKDLIVDSFFKLTKTFVQGGDFTELIALDKFSFENSTLFYCNFDGTFLNGASFAGSTLTGSTFYGASTVGADFSLANISNAEGLYL